MGMKPKIVYKLVREYVTSAGQLKSLYISNVMCTYRLNQWTTPRLEGSKLFCFDTLENAKKYCEFVGIEGEGNGVRLYKCQAVGVSKPKYRASVFYKNFWRTKVVRKKIPDHIAWNLPIGTLWCKKLKLIEQIDLTSK